MPNSDDFILTGYWDVHKDLIEDVKNFKKLQNCHCPILLPKKTEIIYFLKFFLPIEPLDETKPLDKTKSLDETKIIMTAEISSLDKSKIPQFALMNRLEIYNKCKEKCSKKDARFIFDSHRIKAFIAFNLKWKDIKKDNEYFIDNYLKICFQIKCSDKLLIHPIAINNLINQNDKSSWEPYLIRVKISNVSNAEIIRKIFEKSPVNEFFLTYRGITDNKEFYTILNELFVFQPEITSDSINILDRFISSQTPNKFKIQVGPKKQTIFLEIIEYDWY